MRHSLRPLPFDVEKNRQREKLGQTKIVGAKDPKKTAQMFHRNNMSVKLQYPFSSAISRNESSRMEERDSPV